MALDLTALPLAAIGGQVYRIVSSRFPPVSLWDRIANPAEFDALAEIESLTNERLREELGELAHIPRHRRIAGPGTTPIMAAFTHLNPEASRFSDGTFGVFYAARAEATALRETVFHRERFLAAFVAEARATYEDATTRGEMLALADEALPLDNEALQIAETRPTRSKARRNASRKVGA